MSNNPASRRISKALARGDKFAAQFALPGLVPDLVKKDGRVVLFDNERDAEVAALEATARVYDSRTIDTRKAGGYRRMTGAELSSDIATLDISLTYFAEIAGVPQHRAMKWIDGEQDIPHSVHVLVKLMLQSKSNLELAERVTREAQET